MLPAPFKRKRAYSVEDVPSIDAFLKMISSDTYSMYEGTWSLIQDINHYKRDSVIKDTFGMGI